MPQVKSTRVLTSEQLRERRDKQRERYHKRRASRTPEQIENEPRRTHEQKKRRRDLRANMTPEQVARENEKARERRANWSPAEMELDRERQRKRRANRTPEQIERIRERSREYHLKHHRTKKYNLTPGQWEKMFNKQGRRCRICKTDDPKGKGCWHTDHCHVTLKVRGILCQRCNQMLGLAGDNVDTLLSAGDYLLRCSSGVPAEVIH